MDDSFGICGAAFHACRCSLQPHPDFIAHHCQGLAEDDSVCNGKWQGPDENGMMLVIAYPEPGLRAEGMEQITEPVREHDGSYRPGRRIGYYLPPSPVLEAMASITDGHRAPERTVLFKRIGIAEVIVCTAASGRWQAAVDWWERDGSGWRPQSFEPCPTHPGCHHVELHR